MPFRIESVSTLLRVALAVMVLSVPVGAEVQPTYEYLSDPDLTVPPPQELLNERLVPLWIQALGRPEGEERALAAEALAEIHRRKFPGAEAAGPALKAAVVDPATTPAARWSVAQALIVLGLRDSAPQLMEACQIDPTVRPLVEPALAEWDYEPMRAIWRGRLETRSDGRRDVMNAIRGLGQVRDASALELVLAFVRDPAPPADERLAAARAAGQIAETGLEPLAQELAPDQSARILDRLSAAAILTRHASPDAREHLTRLGRDPEPSVAAAALEALLAQDPELVVPLGEEALQSRDANVRWPAIRCYAALPTADRIAALGRALDDVHPRNRYYVREELFRLAGQPEWDAVVREAVMEALGRPGWREHEQACLLAGALDHEPAADLLIERMESRRPEVMACSAWALKKLAIPETLPAMLDKAQRQTDSPTDAPLYIDPQLAHLFEAMGRMDYKPADGLMRTYVPLMRYRTTARCGAIYGLGYLHKGVPDEELAQQLIGRVKHRAGTPPEDVPVRQQAAITIGRMKAASQLTELHLLQGEFTDPFDDDYACRWAIRELSGEDVPLAKVEPYFVKGWFLEPQP